MPLVLAPQHLVYASFAIYAFALGNIFPRLPEVMARMEIAEGALGLGLIGMPLGTLIALTFATPVLDRIGFRRALLGAIPLIAAALAVAIHAPGPLALFLLLVPAGLMIGATEIVVNVEADRTEALLGRRIMNRAHSFWSIGFFGAALFGATMGQLGLTPQMHLALVVPLVLAATALLLGGYRPAPHRLAESSDVAPRFARPTGPILVLVSVTLSAMLLEGASLEWSAIYMQKEFAAGPFLAGIAVATFAFSQALARFFADRFVTRHSPTGVARALLGLSAAGLACVTLSPAPAVSLLGFALLGVGTSALFPLAISAAAQRTDRPASVNVAALAQISFVVFLVAPPLLGFVAEHFGIRWAYGIGLPLIALSLWNAAALGPRRDPAEA